MTDLKAKLGEQQEMLFNRIRKNEKRLRKWRKREQIEAWRAYDRDIPELPLCVELYGDQLHFTVYDRPHERSEAQQRMWEEGMLDAAAAALDVDPDGVVIKRRSRQRAGEQYERILRDENYFTVQEGGAALRVNLRDYLDTGLFLDHRSTRMQVAKESAGRRVLNLFAYTGAFSVHAGKGGAETVTTVDLSPKYLEWAEQNMALNGLDGDAYRYLKGDTFAVLRDLRSHGERFDLVVVDPPTRSRSKRMKGGFDIQRDHVALLQAIFDVCSADAVVYFSNNFTKFKLDEEALAGPSFVEITDKMQAPDFRRRLHRCWRITKG